jgi:zinc and cadmium transporter
MNAQAFLTMLLLLFYSLIGGLFSLLAALFLLWRSDLAKRIMTPLLAFAAGAFLGAVFLDILPEALEHTLENTDDIRPVMIALIVGFLSFFTLERLLMRFMNNARSRSKHEDHTETLPALLIIGDALHNFLDGALIGLAYLANPVLGFTVALSTAAHELPQEIGDFTVLLSSGWSKRKILLANVFQSLMTIPGALLTYYAGSYFEEWLPFMLSGVAGIFLYLAAVNLVPKINHDASHNYTFRVIMPLILGIVLVGALVDFAHSTGVHEHGEEAVDVEQHDHGHDLDPQIQGESTVIPSYASPSASESAIIDPPTSPSPVLQTSPSATPALHYPGDGHGH